MGIIEKIKHEFNGFEISTKITLGYSACFILLLLVINAAMWIGVMDALYRPAEKTIRFSMEHVEKILSELEKNYSGYNPNAFRGALVAGVVLRVVDENGELFLDTDETYPSIETFNAGILLDPPIFADEEFEIARLGSALVYRAEMNYTHEGNNVTLYFF
ncbi:MAG: hypothetical protein J5497_03515, partial [Selenomonadaceae bacterium]|nr:hypothetical protein [Selenomonadaceae bacterium]